MHAMRAQDGDADGFEWDPEQDYGTTFSTFAGWFLVLISYLCKLREVAGVELDDDSDDDDSDVMLQEEMIRTNVSIVAKRRSLRERFLHRRIQCYAPIASQKSTDTNHGQDPQEVDHHVDHDMSATTRSETNHEEIDRLVRLRRKFLSRRVQSYNVGVPAAGGGGGGGVVQPDVRDALKDAYFGQTQTPEPFDFMIGRVEDIHKEIVREKVNIKTMERFLRRRVQGYESPASEKSTT